MSTPTDLWLLAQQIGAERGGNQVSTYGLNGPTRTTRAAGAELPPNPIAPMYGPPVPDGSIGGQPTMVYPPGYSGSVAIDPATGQIVQTPPASPALNAQQIAQGLPLGGAMQTNVPGMPYMPPALQLGGATQFNVPGMPPDALGRDPRFPFASAPKVPAFGSSGLPVNESVLNQNIWDNPQMALLLSGVADPNTPGYNNLSNLGFDPLAVYYASGGSPTQTTGTDYAQWLANMYTTLGTRSDQGGGSITAGPLLQNLVNMPKDSELWKMMKDDPTVFYTMATSVMSAGGMSPMAQSAFKSQMAQLYTEYLAYTSTVPTASDTMVISDWIRTKHPEVVASWGGGG